MENILIKDWFFQLEDIKTAWQKDFDDKNWEAVTVPHDWSVQQNFTKEASSGTGYLPGGVAWYRAHVDLENWQEANTLRLIFEGVYKNAQVWVNGYHLGSRPSGYAEFSFDISDIFSYAPDNDLVIAVRVDHTDIADSRWYNGSGITRPVRLENHQEIQLVENGTFFETISCNDKKANIRITHEVLNNSDEAQEGVIRESLESCQKGKAITFEKQITLAPHEKMTVVFEQTVSDPELWSHDTPNLYHLKTSLGIDNDYEQMVGIRMIQFNSDQGFFINGTSEKLRGVCLHEDAGCFGTAVPDVVWLRRLLTLKEAGTNAIRMAHNPHSQTLYQLCNLLGFYVFDEAFDEWENPKNKWWQGHNVYPPKHEGYAEFFPNWYKEDLENMIDVHKNHPCVIAWSIGNELDYPNDPYANPLFSEMTGNNDASKPEAERIYNPQRPDTRRLSTIATKLAAIVKKKDSSRPVTLAAAFPELSSHTGLLDNLDVIGYNYKEFLYEEDHRRFPNQPLLGSENGHGYKEWLAIKDNDYIAGQFLWTGIDYLGEAHGWPIHGSGAGILTMAGLPKSRYYLRKSWWTSEPMLHLETRVKTQEPYAPTNRTWSYEKGQVGEVFAFSNCEKVELNVDGERKEMAYDTDAGCFKLEISSFEGALQALGYVENTQVSDEIKGSQKAYELDLQNWQVPEDVIGLGNLQEESAISQVVVSLFDCNGSIASDEKEIEVSVTNGRLFGIENGDLGDVTPYTKSSRSTYQGQLIIYVEKEKDCILHVKAEGLDQKELYLD